jgi:hypothetical protein
VCVLRQEGKLSSIYACVLRQEGKLSGIYVCVLRQEGKLSGIYMFRRRFFYIYVFRKCRTQFMLPMEKSVAFTGACANEIIPSIDRPFVYKAKEGRPYLVMEDDDICR